MSEPNVQKISSPPLSTKKVGVEYVPLDSQSIDDDNIVDTKRLIKIKEKVEEAAEAADKASVGFEKLFSTLRDLATVSHGTNETWNDAVKQYISSEKQPSNTQSTTSPTSSTTLNSSVPSKAFVQFADTTPETPTRRKISRRRRQKKLKDPNRPKKPPNAFMMFLVEQCDAMKANLPPGALHAPQVGKIVGERWKELPQEKKKIYEDRYELSKKKYEDDLKIYYSNRDDNPGGPPALISFRANSVIKNNKITVVSSPPNPPDSPKSAKARGYPGIPTLQPLTPDSTNHISIVSQPLKKRKYKKRTEKPRDQNRPRKPANPYALYLAEQCHLMKTKPDPSNALNAPHIGRVISERWRMLSPESKKVYQDRYHAAKNRYDQEMRTYNASIGSKLGYGNHISKSPIASTEPISPTTKEEHENQKPAIPLKVNHIKRVPLSGDDYEDGKPLPNADDDDDYDYDEMFEDSITQNKIQGKSNVETAESSDMQDIIRTPSSGIVRSKKETLDIKIPREPRKRTRDIEEEEEESGDTSGSDSQDEAAAGSDSTGLGTPNSNGEISPSSKWSLKGLFSNFKRAKFF